MNATGNRLQALLLALLFIVALGIRVFGLTDPPLEFHPTKQFRSALTTRAYYYEVAPPAEQWRQDVSRDNLQRIGVIVPTPQERAIAWIYHLTGGERIWLGRLFSVVCWLAGGVLLFALARRIASFEGAFVGVSFYLLLPFSVIASQSYQPDPPMVLAVIASIYLSVRHHDKPTAPRFLAAASVAAVAVFIKPISIFMVAAGFVGGAIGLRSGHKKFNSIELLAFLLIAVLPSLAFYLYRILVHSYAEWQREASFLPAYILESRFWDDWLKRLRISLGITYFVAGLVGALLAASGLARPLLVSLWVGYFVMCFAVTYKISTHDYYHLPLIPVVALGIAQLADPLVERMSRQAGSRLWTVAVWSAVLLGLFVAAGTSVQARRRVPSFEGEIAVSRAVGTIVGHSTRVMFLAPEYGHPLMYYGELSGRYWPYWYDIRDEKLHGPSPRSAAERLAKMTANEDFDYFVVLDREELERQPDLRQVLQRQFPVYSQGDDYLIFDMRQDTRGRSPPSLRPQGSG